MNEQITGPPVLQMSDSECLFFFWQGVTAFTPHFLLLHAHCNRWKISWSYMYFILMVFITLRPFLQADEGPDEKDGQPEAQGAAGEEQERPADGGRQETRGQPQRELPADQGKGGLLLPPAPPEG